MLSCNLKAASKCIDPGHLERGFSVGQVQLLSVVNPGLHVRSYKANCGWLLPVLDLKEHERGHTVNQAPLQTILSLGPFSK